MLKYFPLSCLTFCILACSDVQTTHYDTAAEAHEDRLFERGWLPDVLPASAASIVETHDIDTNERCAQASVPVRSRPQLEVALQMAGFSETEGRPAALPFEGCTFAAPESEKIEVTYTRMSTAEKVQGASPETEYVVLVGETFYFWSAEPGAE